MSVLLNILRFWLFCARAEAQVITMRKETDRASRQENPAWQMPNLTYRP